MKLLTNGCSFSHGPESWPYALQEKLGCDLVNLGMPSAGNTYIHDSTISELSKNKYDMVIIMWSGMSRLDLKVSDVSEFKGSHASSEYQVSINDFAAKIIENGNESDLIEKDWIFLHHTAHAKHKLLEDYQKTYRLYSGSVDILVYNTLIKLISLQSVLKQMNIKYLFTFYIDYFDKLRSNETLFSMLDLENIFVEDNLHEIAKRNNWFAEDNSHPGALAHEQWASLIFNKYND